MIDCAYVEPNEPQMIDITFVKSCFLGKWLISFGKPPRGDTISRASTAPVWALSALIGCAPCWSPPPDDMKTPALWAKGSNKPRCLSVSAGSGQQQNNIWSWRSCAGYMYRSEAAMIHRRDNRSGGARQVLARRLRVSAALLDVVLVGWTEKRVTELWEIRCWLWLVAQLHFPLKCTELRPNTGRKLEWRVGDVVSEHDSDLVFLFCCCTWHDYISSLNNNTVFSAL